MQVPSIRTGVFVVINMIHLGRLQTVMQSAEGIPTKYVEEHGQMLCMKFQVPSLIQLFHVQDWASDNLLYALL